MDTQLQQIIDDFEGLEVLVIGEAMLDVYLHGNCTRVAPEAPVPVVRLEDRKTAPGGAANVAVNISNMGGQVHFLSACGRDLEGVMLCQGLRDHGVDPEYIIQDERRQTLAKHRIMAGDQMLVRFDQGTETSIGGKVEAALIKHLIQLYPQCDAVIVSDYGYGVITDAVISALADLQAQFPRALIVDSKRLPAFKDIHVTAIKPNYKQTLDLLGLTDPVTTNARAELILPYGEDILELTGAQIAAVTLDSDGVLMLEKRRPPYRTYATPHPGAKTSGAGDTFTAALTLALAAGAPVPAAAEIASAAAGVVVRFDGTSACTLSELKAVFTTDHKYEPDLRLLLAQIRRYRQQGRRIVFTNGCFDILHRGHITYLSHAKALGDILIVGLNSDDSVRRLKGPTRPINPVDDRAGVLAGLSAVDHIVPFDEDTPHNLIQLIQPDVFVKGGDYTRDTLPEASLVEELGGRVHLMPFIAERSTTGVIERIRQMLVQQDVSLKQGNGHARR